MMGSRMWRHGELSQLRQQWQPVADRGQQRQRSHLRLCRQRPAANGDRSLRHVASTQNRLASVAVTNLSGNGIANQTLTTSYNYALYGNGMVHTLSVTHPSPSNSDTD